MPTENMLSGRVTSVINGGLVAEVFSVTTEEGNPRDSDEGVVMMLLDEL